MMDQLQIINQAKKYTQECLKDRESGHDWWHALRVWHLGKYIAQEEKVASFEVELIALLHDLDDAKFTPKQNPKKSKVQEFLLTHNFPDSKIQAMVTTIKQIAFRNQKLAPKQKSPLLKIVQDADRLDAIGAIGIARTFNYGGHKGREIYNPNIKPQLNQTKEQYQKSTAPTINHFYEKLLLLKDQMNTHTGKRLAERRHRFMAEFLTEFYREWNREIL
jgi:uncharacterized protein